MGVEVRPFGVKCNIACQYCYQNPERDAGNVLHRYDLDKMIAAIERWGRAFTLFGGEPLLMPLEDLERIWAYGLLRFKHNAIQTNGTLVNDTHIEFFERFKVQVGISVDGPGECNDVRWNGTLEKTREATARTLDAIDRLCAKGQPPGLIVTLHRGNATGERLPQMVEWVRGLDRKGVKSMRLHLLEVEDGRIRQKYSLEPAEALHALTTFRDLEPTLTRLRFDLFAEMRRLLVGEDDKSTCVWAGCDPYDTDAVQGIEGNGQQSNCGRTNKDGVDFVKSAQRGFERYLALHATPQQHGGCQGCRFFLMCKGQCPGTAIDGDWRNRTEHCEVLMELFGQLEEELVAKGRTPISLQPELRQRLEGGFLKAWRVGRNTKMSKLLKADAPRELRPQGVS